MERNMTKKMLRYEQKLIECESEMEKLQEGTSYEKIDINDEFFYTKLPF
jgi:hypothetical protein